MGLTDRRSNQARTAFLDNNARVIPDPDHSKVKTDAFNWVVYFTAGPAVSHCYRQAKFVRIISARRANRNEAREYNGG